MTLTPSRPDAALTSAPGGVRWADGAGAGGALREDFPATAPAAHPVFYRTYSRRNDNGRESWAEVVERNLAGLHRLGHLNEGEE